MMFFIGLVAKIIEVVVIHRDDEIKRLEVHGAHSSCLYLSQRIAATFRRLASTIIWLAAPMVGMRAGRIGMHERCKACVIHEFTENAFGRRRPTDITHANKQHRNLNIATHKYLSYIEIFSSSGIRILNGLVKNRS